MVTCLEEHASKIYSSTLWYLVQVGQHSDWYPGQANQSRFLKKDWEDTSLCNSNQSARYNIHKNISKDTHTLSPLQTQASNPKPTNSHAHHSHSPSHAHSHNNYTRKISWLGNMYKYYLDSKSSDHLLLFKVTINRSRFFNNHTLNILWYCAVHYMNLAAQSTRVIVTELE